MSLQLSGNGVVTGLDSVGSSDLGSLLGSKLDLAGGKIMQIVRATDSTERTTTSTSFTDVTGMSVTITPQKSNSAVLIVATFFAQVLWTSGDLGIAYYQISDSSNNGISGASLCRVGSNNLSGTSQRSFNVQQNLLAYSTPATENATTYKMRFRCETGGSGLQALLRNDEVAGQLYAIEVSA
jgi:hypothetical protein